MSKTEVNRIKIPQKPTLTVKSWIDLLPDWLAIVLFDRKVHQTGLENATLIDGEDNETCEKRKRVCLELAENCFGESSEADKAVTLRFLRKRKRLEVQSIEIQSREWASIYVSVEICRRQICTSTRA